MQAITDILVPGQNVDMLDLRNWLSDLTLDGQPRTAVRGRSPGIIRSQQQLADEGLSLTKDFGAVGDNSTNNGSKINDAVAAAIGDGLDLEVPPGNFRYSTPVDQTFSTTAIIDGGKRPTIHGRGSGLSRLIFTGTNAETAIRLVGNHPQLEALTIRGLGIMRPNAPLGSGLTGAGLLLEKMLGPTLEDVLCFNHGIGLRTLGTLVLTARRLVTFFNRQGGSFEYSNISGPNVMSFIGCAFNQNNNGLLFDQGCGITFTGCTFEGTGNTNTTTTPEDTWALKMTNMGREGQIALTGLDGCYFEANLGTDIIIEHKEFSASYNFGGAIFQRYTVANRPIISFLDALAGSGGYAANDAEIILNGAQVRRYASGGGVATPSSTTPVLKLESPSTFSRLTIRDAELGYTTAGNSAHTWRNTAERTDYGSRTLRYEGPVPAPTYQNSWVSGGAGNTFYADRHLNGFVELGGQVTSGTTADGTVMLTLPVNVRPTRTYEQFAATASTGLCQIRVGSNGNCEIYGASGASWVSFSGIRFKCE